VEIQQSKSGHRSSRLPLPRRSDELVMAMLVALTLVAGVVVWAVRTGEVPWVDVDELEPRAIEFQIDLQTATWPEFTLIPGIGEKLAKRIVASRETEGLFTEPDELTRVRGIGPVLMEQIRPYLLDNRVATDNRGTAH
jgi:competence protein ComEA